MKVYEYLLERIDEKGFVHLSLIDPDPFKVPLEKAARIAKIAENAGSDAIMVGGSTATVDVEAYVRIIKENVSLPVILFPNDVSGLAPSADAAFFMVLVNSRNRYYLFGAQVLGAIAIRRLGLEPISMAYMVFEPGGTVGFMGDARLIPRNKPEIAVGYALAAEIIGFKTIYLEAGSGAYGPLPPEIIAAVSKSVKIPVIVGGGINKPEEAAQAIAAGASMVVQSTFLERIAYDTDAVEKLSSVIRAMKEASKKKR